ncbi:MAG TPA: MBL fold metallo-hydrolase [Allosphingosinicella sp.]|jgi:beta-lactamase superfamily II metal-dependent hydrolase
MAFALLAGSACLALNPSRALAQDIVIQRDVTVRSGPSRTSAILDYAAPGEQFDLLDVGRQQNGYYHVRLPDGRTGWIYRSFIRRTDAAPNPPPPAAARDQISVHYIDVEQGNAALLETPCGAIMIDAGGRGPAAGAHLIDYLNRFFERRPDLQRTLAALFVTHTHIDHNSNLRRVAESFHVSRYIHNSLLNGSGRVAANWIVDFAGRTTPRVTVAALADLPAQGVTNNTIDPLACPRVDPQIRVLSGGFTQNPGWPASEFENGNNHSLVIRVDYGESSFLFPGDLEDTAIERLVHRLEGTSDLDVDVYTVGHHGSANGTTPSFVRAMAPEMAVISMGPSNVQAQWTAFAYGHPRRTIVELLDAAITRMRPQQRTVTVADRTRAFTPYRMTDAIYATGWDGDVVVTGDADGTLQVRTSR